MTIFERIETLRKSRKISQGKLEKELGFSNGSISKWKTSMPNAERLQKLSDYFNVSLEYLTTGKEYEMYSVENAELLARIAKNKDAMRLMEYYIKLSESDRKEIGMMVEYKANKKE